MVGTKRHEHRSDCLDSRYVSRRLADMEELLILRYEGTGGVSVFALKLARAAGLQVILTSSSNHKLEKMKEKYPNPPLLTVNYSETPNWHEEVLRLTDGVGVDIVVENGGTPSLVQSMRCTRRGGIVSQVGYLGKQNPQDLAELVPIIIDRRVILRQVLH